MKPHFHLGLLSGVTTMLNLLILMFLWRMAAIRLAASDDPGTAEWGQAMSIIF